MVEAQFNFRFIKHKKNAYLHKEDVAEYIRIISMNVADPPCNCNYKEKLSNVDTVQTAARNILEMDE